MKEPSTDWKEDIAEDEEERFARFGKQFGLLQKIKSREFGPGRTLHRKQILGFEATFEVRGDIPEHARHGLFSFPGNHDAWVRLSNGSLSVQSDQTRDVRGFAIKVRGLDGEGALGGSTDCQDFLLINLPAFSSPKGEDFVNMMGAASQGNAPLLKFMVGNYGLLGGLNRMRKLVSSLSRRFTGFATERFYSAAPLACGPYAVRVRLLPDSAQKPISRKPADLGLDMRKRLESGTMSFDFQLQFFVDEKHTPIEDASVDWSESHSPYVTVGRLHVPVQTGEALDSLQDKIEQAAFDPWKALKDHRPLGNVMRTRKVVYLASQKGRKAK